MLNPLIYGSLTGLLLGGWTLFMFFMGFYDDPDSEWIYLDAVKFFIPIAGIAFGIHQLKQQYADRFTFKVGFLAGLNISAVAALVSTLTLFFLHNQVGPETLEQLRSGYGPDVAPADVAKIEALRNFTAVMFYGIVVSAVLGIMMRKKGKDTPPSQPLNFE